MKRLMLAAVAAMPLALTGSGLNRAGAYSEESDTLGRIARNHADQLRRITDSYVDRIAARQAAERLEQQTFQGIWMFDRTYGWLFVQPGVGGHWVHGASFGWIFVPAR